MNARARRRGFSFVEVLFAVFLVGLSATILTALMPTAHRARHKANQQAKAMGLAQKQMEAIRGVGYPNLTANGLYSYGLISSTTPVATNTYNSTSVDSAAYDSVSKILPSGQGTVKIESAGLDLRRVTVEVRWKERGKDFSFKVATVVANL